MSAARPTPIRLLVVDDHEVVRVGLRTLLHHHGMIIVGEAGTKAAAVRAVTPNLTFAPSARDGFHQLENE